MQVIQSLNKLYDEGKFEVRNEILKEIRETDEEIAFHQYRLIMSALNLCVMCVGRLTYLVTDRLLAKHFG